MAPAINKVWPTDESAEAGTENVSSAQPTEIPKYPSPPCGSPIEIDVAGIGRLPVHCILRFGTAVLPGTDLTDPDQEECDEMLNIPNRYGEPDNFIVKDCGFHEQRISIFGGTTLQSMYDRKDGCFIVCLIFHGHLRDATRRFQIAFR